MNAGVFALYKHLCRLADQLGVCVPAEDAFTRFAWPIHELVFPPLLTCLNKHQLADFVAAHRNELAGQRVVASVETMRRRDATYRRVFLRLFCKLVNELALPDVSPVALDDVGPRAHALVRSLVLACEQKRQEEQQQEQQQQEQQKQEQQKQQEEVQQRGGGSSNSGKDNAGDDDDGAASAVKSAKVSAKQAAKANNPTALAAKSAKTRPGTAAPATSSTVTASSTLLSRSPVHRPSTAATSSSLASSVRRKSAGRTAPRPDWVFDTTTVVDDAEAAAGPSRKKPSRTTASRRHTIAAGVITPAAGKAEVLDWCSDTTIERADDRESATVTGLRRENDQLRATVQELSDLRDLLVTGRDASTADERTVLIEQARCVQLERQISLLSTALHRNRDAADATDAVLADALRTLPREYHARLQAAKTTLREAREADDRVWRARFYWPHSLTCIAHTEADVDRPESFTYRDLYPSLHVTEDPDQVVEQLHVAKTRIRDLERRIRYLERERLVSSTDG